MRMNKFKLSAFADEAGEKLSDQIAAMRDGNIDYLEIRGVDGVNIASIPESKIKEIKNQLDAAGKGTWAIGSPTGKIKIDDDFAPHVEEFKRMLESASILGAQKFRMFSFYGTGGDKKYKNAVIERLSKLCEIAKPYNIVLCHENEKGIYGADIEGSVEVLESVEGLRAVFDPANFVQCGIDTLKAWDALESYVDYVHIKDSKLDGSIVPAGSGDGKIKEILKRYAAINGKVITLEPHLWEFDGLAGLEEEGDKSNVGGLNFPSQREAFDAAVDALRNIVTSM